MKILIKLKSLISILLMLLFISACDSFLNEFKDFDYTTTYFAFQYPVRTLVLGETEYYNTTNDRNHRFEIKASLGGVYKNKKSIQVKFEIDESLVEGLGLSSTQPLKLLPTTHYEPIASNNFQIPAGSFNGGFTVQLTDAFFNDPLSYANNYVLPVRIISSATDSVLTGIPISEESISPFPVITEKWGVDPRISENWEIQPKNFTVYIIKYINEYHGVYLRRGTEMDQANSTIQGYGWENKYIEKTTYTPKLQTRALNKLLYDDRLVASNVQFKALIEVKEDNSVVISTDPASGVDVTGTGKYTNDVEEWGGKKRQAFYLDYKVTNREDQKVYTVKDTLVFRDNTVSFETFSPVVN